VSRYSDEFATKFIYLFQKFNWSFLKTAEKINQEVIFAVKRLASFDGEGELLSNNSSELHRTAHREGANFCLSDN